MWVAGNPNVDILERSKHRKIVLESKRSSGCFDRPKALISSQEGKSSSLMGTLRAEAEVSARYDCVSWNAAALRAHGTIADKAMGSPPTGPGSAWKVEAPSGPAYSCCSNCKSKLLVCQSKIDIKWWQLSLSYD